MLATNKQDGGSRRFILVEMEEDICRSITAQRLARAINGYMARGVVASISDRREEDRRSETAATTLASIADQRRSETAATIPEPSNEGKPVGGLGGGFRYCILGAPLFDESGRVCGTVRFPDLAAHVFFAETGTPIPTRATGKTPLLGEHNGKAVYLLFNGVMSDKRVNGGNVLTGEIVKRLPEPTRRSEAAAVAAISDRRLVGQRPTLQRTSVGDRRYNALGVKCHRHSGLPSSAMPIPWAAILIALGAGRSSLSIRLLDGAGHFSRASRSRKIDVRTAGSPPAATLFRPFRACIGKNGFSDPGRAYASLSSASTSRRNAGSLVSTTSQTTRLSTSA